MGEAGGSSIPDGLTSSHKTLPLQISTIFFIVPLLVTKPLQAGLQDFPIEAATGVYWEPLHTGLACRSPSFLFTTRCGCFSLSSPGTRRDTLSGDRLLSVSWLPLAMLNCWPSVAEGSLLYGLMGSVFLGSIVLSLPQAAGSSRMEKGMRPNHILGTRKVPVSPSGLASAPAQG